MKRANSTPIHASKKPRLSFTPLKKGQALYLVEECNDEVERSERRQSAAFKTLISTSQFGLDSPATKSLSVSNMMSNLQTITKLYIGNKINAHNVWQIQVIDVLKVISAKETRDPIQVVGSSLEIANKVYGLRIDCLHSEGIKLSGNLNRNVHVTDENLDDSNGAASEDNPKKTNKSKPRRLLMSADKRNIIKRAPNSFTAPLSKLTSTEFAIRSDRSRSAIGNLLTNQIPMDSIGYKFTFLSKETAWKWGIGNDRSVTVRENVTVPPLRPQNIETASLSAPLRKFEIGQSNDDGDNFDGTSNILSELAVDSDGIPIHVLDGSIHDVFEERDSDDDGTESAEGVRFCPESGNRFTFGLYPFINHTPGQGESDTTIVLGPSYWKLKGIRRTREIYTGTDEMPKKKKSQKRKEVAFYEPIDFSKLPPRKELPENIAKERTRRRNNVAPQEKITLPLVEAPAKEDFQFLYYKFSRPNEKIEPIFNQVPDQNYNISDYNANNHSVSDYCPDLDHSPDIDDHEGIITSEARQTGDLMDNLVDAPEMVVQTVVPYASKAKQISMKQLKTAEWRILTRTPKNESTAKVVPIKFSTLMRMLPGAVSKKTREDLSGGLAFIMLLQLCNEKHLELTQIDISDFEIKGPT